jgi:hypothetical protein
LDPERVMTLSEEARNAVPIAAEMIEKLVTDFASGRRIPENFPNHPSADIRSA